MFERQLTKTGLCGWL